MNSNQGSRKRKQKRKEKRRRPRSPGLLGFSARQRPAAPPARSKPAQLARSSPARVAHARAPPRFPCCRCHLASHVSLTPQQCRLPPRLNRRVTGGRQPWQGRARGSHARGTTLSPWRRAHAISAPTTHAPRCRSMRSAQSPAVRHWSSELWL